MASMPSPIRKWIEQFTSERGFFSSSSDVDHDSTSNRTHDGDDLTPATLEASGKVILPTAIEGDTVSETGVLAYDETNEQLLVSK